MPQSPTPTLAPAAAYQVLCARDARFDGRIFVGVTSTGIYCRPVCRVRVPQEKNCRFFNHAAQAESAGFRPCLRCRPELAPGLSLVDSSAVLASQAARWMTQAVLAGEPLALPGLAARLGVTDRHLRRIFMQAHGVSPIAWLATQRLLLAKQLLTDTDMPVTEVALASGFSSLRRFHAAMAQQYRLNPGQMRAQRPTGSTGSTGSTNVSNASNATGATGAIKASRSRSGAAAGTATLWLAWRPPYDLAGVCRFMARRALPGVEQVQAETSRPCLRRTLAVKHQGQTLTGWLQATWVPERHAVALQLSASLLPAAGAMLARCRQALDLNADPSAIDAALSHLPGRPRPGVRVPGAWCGFESAVRVVLGQQVTVAAGCTLAHRLVQRFGQPMDTPHAGLDRLFPSASALAQADPADIGTLGIVRQRVRAIQALAAAVDSGQLQLDQSAPLEASLQALLALPGVGPWTAQLVAMRALAWPDAWLPTDIAVLKALNTRDPAVATLAVEACRPWRAYAVMRLWLGSEPEIDGGLADTAMPSAELPGTDPSMAGLAVASAPSTKTRSAAKAATQRSPHEPPPTH